MGTSPRRSSDRSSRAPRPHCIPQWRQIRHGCMQDCADVRRLAILRAHIAVPHREGWREWPCETPATTAQAERCQFHQATTSLGDVESGFEPLPRTPAEVFFMPPESLTCKECKTPYPLDASYVCERCFGPLEVTYASRDGRRAPRSCAAASRPGPHSIWRYRDFLPLEGGPPRGGAAGRLDAAAARRPPRRAPRPARGLDQERRREPDALLQGPRRRRRAGARASSSASRRSRAPRRATSRTPSRRTPRRPGSSPTSSSPRDLEEPKILATGVYGTNARRHPRQLRRRQPPLHGGLRRAADGRS